MGFYSIWPLFVCLTLLVFVADSPAFRPIDADPISGTRTPNGIDGLRGFLALSVYFYHNSIYNGYLRTGNWTPPPSAFYSVLGPTGVSLFFMITGFLFWGKLVEREGRQEWMKVYVGRIFRIGPVYLLAIIIMFAIVFDRTGFRLHVPSKVLATQMGDWLLLGLFAPSINGSIQSMIALAGVTWTLRYEWFFYFSLPFIAVLARYRWAHLPFSIAGFFVLIGLSSYEHSGVSSLLALFGVGMIAASLNALKVVPKVPNYLSSSLVVLSLITAFTLRSSMPAISSTFLIGFAFYLIASGCTVFGLLTTRAARRLGDISYGIYLLQGIVMAFLFSWGPARKFSLASPAGHWAVALAGALLLIGFAGVAHIFVERPGIRLGRKLISPRKLIAARSAAVL